MDHQQSQIFHQIRKLWRKWKVSVESLWTVECRWSNRKEKTKKRFIIEVEVWKLTIDSDGEREKTNQNKSKSINGNPRW